MAEAIKTIGDVGAGHTLGRYELLIPIATGGMAVVWAARLKGTRGFQKLVAIKTIRADMTEDPQFEQMFLDEASLAARIRHPHVVEILDLGDEKKTLFIVMEWIDGEPLHVIMKEAASKGGIQLPVAVRIATQLCAGLHAAHELRDDTGKLFGVVHRDVSPQNVLVTYDGVAKLVDFGVAKAQGRAGETQAGQVKGKVAYMAPEQARGGTVDRRTDIFALGIVLYTITTGKHPFRRENEMATMMNICSDTRAYRPSKLIPGYPPALETVVLQALEKDPAKRFPTANDMMRALDQALPSSMRASTDEEVASFVRALLGDRQQKRKDAIRDALRIADDRTDATKLMRPLRSSPDASNTGLVPLNAVTATDVLKSAAAKTGNTDPKSERWAFESNSTVTPVSTGSETNPGTGSGPSLLQAVESGPLLAPPDIRGMAERKKRLSPTTWIAVSALIVAAAAVIGMLVAFRSREPAQPTASPARPAPLASPATALPSAPVAVASDAVVTAVSAQPAESGSSTPAPAESREVRGAGPSGTRPAGTKTAPGATPTETTKAPPTKTNLPQVRDPGF